MNKFSNANIINYVSKLTFAQTACIIQHGKILFCCDGGLMHAASAVNTCFIPLFANVESDMRLTKSDNALPLFDKNDVNNIEIDDIFKKYLEAKMLLKLK
jgi:ADP-heptose:LPS heptosyltransferase